MLGSGCQVYTDKNPPTYVLESKLGASQNQWLSELVLFNFVIKYRTGCFKRAIDALSCHPFNSLCHDSTSQSETNIDEVEIISYTSVCEAIALCLNSTKISGNLKQEAQNISCAMQPIIEEKDKDEIVSNLNSVSIFDKVTPKKMAEEQQKEPTLELIYQLVTAGEKPKTSAIAKIKSKAVRKYLLQFDRLTMKKRTTTSAVHQ